LIVIVLSSTITRLRFPSCGFIYNEYMIVGKDYLWLLELIV
jgi:hypothetical protein